MRVGHLKFEAVFAQQNLGIHALRLVVKRLSRDFPYAPSVFSNRVRAAGTLSMLNMTKTFRDAVYAEISVTPGHRLRTASKRIPMLDWESIGAHASPLTIQDRHDEVFDVEAVKEKFFEDFCKVFELVAKDIREHNNWEGDIVEKETQTLLDPLLFLYFIQRNGWLNRERDYLYKPKGAASIPRFSMGTKSRTSWPM